jgi:hypothetical protein
MSRRTCSLAVLVAAAALAGATACAPGSDDAADDLPATVSTRSIETISFEEWQAQFTAICDEYEPQQNAIAAEHGPAQTPADAVALIDDLTPVLERYVDALLAVEVPAARRRDVSRAYDLLATLEGDIAALRAAAAGDGLGARDVLVTAQLHSTELQALLDDLDVPACA